MNEIRVLVRLRLCFRPNLLWPRRKWLLRSSVSDFLFLVYVPIILLHPLILPPHSLHLNLPFTPHPPHTLGVCPPLPVCFPRSSCPSAPLFLPFFAWTESQFELSEQMRGVGDHLNGHK